MSDRAHGHWHDHDFLHAVYKTNQAPSQVRDHAAHRSKIVHQVGAGHRVHARHYRKRAGGRRTAHQSQSDRGQDKRAQGGEYCLRFLND